MRRPIIILAVLFLFMITSFGGCATIFYPERQGHHGGRLDVGMFALDLVLLLFWLIPGVVALAVDFGTGAIYMDYAPPGSDLPQNMTDATRVEIDKLAMPASGTFKYSLPVRGDGAHVVTLTVVDESGVIVAEDTNSVRAGRDWDKIESELTMNAGDAENGKLQIAIDGKTKAEIPVEFVAVGGN
ncbi:MAG: hypothetical protein ACYS8W_20990 [Planctomycetota bacterium]